MPGVRRGRLLVALALTGAVLAGCSGGGAPRGTVNVPMYDNFFAREVTRVPAGAAVRFPNEGRAPHNAVAVDGSWGTPTQIGADQAATVVLDRPGVYRFYCTFHATEDGRQGMAATMVVGDVSYYPGQEVAGPELVPVERASGFTRRVPEDHETIQEAVGAARPGDLVLIGPGVYREEVKVAVPSLILRGRDRNRVVIDGEFLRPNGISVTADEVAVENLTVRNALINGLFWTGVRGYRASYVTAYNNKDYGIYAFDSADGLFEHSYASGSPDSGFYIGQCHPCDAVIDQVVAERNGLGYSGTNAGGNLQIVRSLWRANWAGIVPNTLDSELLPPFRQVDIVGNRVEANHNRDAPGVPLEWGPFGNGIVLGGGNDSRVERNHVLDHVNNGILVTPNIDKHVWTATGNRVAGNLVEGSGRADLALAGPAGAGNCFEGNRARTSIPVGLQAFHRCSGPRLPLRMDLSTTLASLGQVAEANTGAYPRNRPEDQPVPPPQEQLPGGAGAPVQPAVDVFQHHQVDLATVPLPAPSDQPSTVRKEPTVFGVPILAASPWQLVFALYGYLLPFVLYAAWTSLALWDLARRDDLGRGAAIGWIAVVLVVPFLGVIAYHVVGRPKLPAWLRAAVVGGGLVAYLVVLGVGALLGGIA
ncbi:MAG TPA: right-handed parallel beta-helix repeat-containing protein [Actinomycetota bacterium]|nr:right-handed parallel beta-helix repeat-containing protein [Actinomycetota bacterium]